MAGVGTFTNPLAAILFAKLLFFNEGGMWAGLGLILMVILFVQGTPEIMGLFK